MQSLWRRHNTSQRPASVAFSWCTKKQNALEEVEAKFVAAGKRTLQTHTDRNRCE